MKKIKFNYAFYGLIFLTFAVSSCSSDNPIIEENLEVKAEDGLHVDVTQYDYMYNKQTYSLEELNASYPELLENAYIFSEGDEVNYVFDNEKEAMAYDAATTAKDFQDTNDSIPGKASGCKDDGNNSTWGFKIRFYDGTNYTGAWWQLRKKGIPVTKSYIEANIPVSFNDKASSIVLDELDYSQNPRGGRTNIFTFICFEDYNTNGRGSVAIQWLNGCNRVFSNLRKGNWNNKISSFRLNGGGT